MLKPLRILTVILFASATVHSTTAACDPLLRVLKSEQFKKIVRTSEQIGGKHIELWADPDSHYGSLFKNNKKNSQVIEWITASMRNNPHEKITQHRKAEYLSVSTTFREGLTSEVKLKVIVPHPKYTTAAAYGVLQATREQQPAKSQILSKETLTLHHTDAEAVSFKRWKLLVANDSSKRNIAYTINREM